MRRQRPVGPRDLPRAVVHHDVVTDGIDVFYPLPFGPLQLRSNQSVPSCSLSLGAMRMKIAATCWFRRDRFAAISLGSARVSISFCISRAFARSHSEVSGETGPFPGI